MGSFLHQLAARKKGDPRKEEADKSRRLQGKGRDTSERALVVSDTLEDVAGARAAATAHNRTLGHGSHCTSCSRSRRSPTGSTNSGSRATPIERSVELGVHEHGAGYFAWKPCEVALRRLLLHPLGTLV